MKLLLPVMLASTLLPSIASEATACGGNLVTDATEVFASLPPVEQKVIFAGVGCHVAGSTGQIVQCACQHLKPCDIAEKINGYAGSAALKMEIKLNCR